MDKVTITYLGHACFSMTYEGYRTIIDPYRDNCVPGLPPLQEQANAVFCSHGHNDHNGAEAVTLLPGKAPYTLEELQTDHDDQGGALRGSNTVRIFRCGSLRVAHMGDIGRPLTASECEALRGVDCMMVPVGGFFTIDAAQAKAMADAVQPRVVIPMHFRTGTSGYDVIAPVEDFLKLYPSYETGTVLELTNETPAQVLLLRNQIKE